MAGLNVDNSTIAIRTSTGTDSFSFDSGFGTPDCAIVVGGRCETLGTLESSLHFSVGFVDGTSEFVASIVERENRTTVTSRKRYSASHCALTINPASGAVLSSAEFSSFSADTLTINWDDAPPAAAQFTAYGFSLPSGSSVAVSNFAASTSLDGSVDVTALGAEADLVILTTAWTTTVDTTSTDATHGIGVYSKSGGQRGVSMHIVHGSPNGDPRVLHNSNYALQLNSGTSLGVGIELSGHASGFTATTRVLGGAPAFQIGYLAISFPAGTHRADVGAFDVPTATGTDATTGVGFPPDFLFGLLASVDTVNVVQSDASAEAYGFSFAKGTAVADQACQSVHSEYNSASSNVHNVADDTFVQIMDGSTPNLQTAALDSLDSDGFTLDWTAAPLSTAGFSGYLALQRLDPITATLAGSATISEADLQDFIVSSPITATLSGGATVSEAALAGIGVLGAALPGAGSVAAPIAGVGVIDATLAGAGSLTAAVEGVGVASATLAGSGAVSAAIEGIGVLAATLPGVGAIPAAAGSFGTAAVSATLAGAGSIAAAALAGIGTLAATLPGVGAVATADLSVPPSPVTATLAGSAAVAAPLVGIGALASTLPGSATLAAPIAGFGSVAATLAGAATTTAPIVGIASVAATLPGSGAVSEANLVDATGGISPIAATLAGAGAIPSAPLVGFGVLGSSLAGSGSVSEASLTGAPVAVSAILAGTGAIGAADLTGGPAAITAALPGSGAIAAADLVGLGVLGATLAGSGTISEADLADSGGGFSAITATLAGAGAVSAALEGLGTLAATLPGAGAIGAAALSGAGAPISATLTGSGAVGGADLSSGPAPLSAVLASSASISAAGLVGFAALAATLPGIATTSAALVGFGSLAATLPGSAAIPAAALADSTVLIDLKVLSFSLAVADAVSATRALSGTM